MLAQVLAVGLYLCICVCVSVCLSVTRRYCIKTAAWIELDCYISK